MTNPLEELRTALYAGAELSIHAAMKIRLTVGLTAAALVACGRGKADARSASLPAAATGVAVASASPSATTSSSTEKETCPRTGQWAQCSVEKRLIQSGFVPVPVKGTPTRRTGYSVLPSVYQLGESHLEVFLYPNATAAGRDVAGLDTLTASPRGSRGDWGASPTFVRSVNLIAILLTSSPVKAERLSLALTAGAPQP